MSRSVAFALVLTLAAAARAQPVDPDAQTVRSGQSAYGGWQDDAPGVARVITPADLPPPGQTRSSGSAPAVMSRPSGAAPKVPWGFVVTPFATGLEGPRVIRVAPDGDVFVAETDAGQIRVFRDATGSAQPAEGDIFAADLDLPFGIAFYPERDPQWVYVALSDKVVRFPYRNGDLKARGAAETIVGDLPIGGHQTRDIAFSPDGRALFLSIGSESNDGAGMPRRDPPQIRAWEAEHGVGAAWGDETNRADVLSVAPDGAGGLKPFATGLRNCVGMAIEPGTGDLWCATNERDGLGDNLPPDYVTRVLQGQFYGWPWYYIGDHPDPRHAGERPDLAGRAAVPDVLIQPHSAPLQIVFYDGTQFPADYRGDAFVTLHGSWNRADRTGYKMVRVRFRNGRPTGVYEDFLTGFVAGPRSVWGRPVGVAVAHDGSLLVSDDANGTIWRIRYQGG